MKALLLLLLSLCAGAADLRPVELKLPAGPALPAGRGPGAAFSMPAFSLAGTTPGLRLDAPSLAALPALPGVPSLPKAAVPAGAASFRPAGAAKGPEAGRSILGALGAFHGRIAASLRGGEPGDPGFGGFFDGEGERSDEEAFIRREEKKAEEKKQAHAERPVLDYLRNRFNEEEARELAEAEYEFAGGRKMSGKQALQLIVTAHAARTDNPPDLTRVDPALFGVSDTDLRDVAAREGLPPFALQNFYDLAFRRGLIYRLSDSNRGRTYYGVPDLVRSFLGLEAPRPAAEAAKEKARASAFARSLPELAQAALALPRGEELFEFAAQIAEAAVKDKLLEREALPQAFRDRAEAIDFDASPLKDALLTFLESAEGTPWFERAVALCEQAAADGLLPRDELDDLLDSLR